MFETLESRRLLTVLVDVHLDGSTLIIEGSSGTDLIYVGRNNSGQLSVVALNAITQMQQGQLIHLPLVRNFAMSDVSAIDVELKGGNDLLHKTSPDIANVVVWGGAGNDAIVGYFGGTDNQGAAIPAYVYGQSGNDTLSIAGPYCYADGGSGADTFGNYLNLTGPIVDYSSRSANLRVDMNFAGGDGEAGENDTVLPSCYGIRGGSGNDFLVGASSVAGTVNNGEGAFWGNAGHDTIHGGVGFDVINGGDGDDRLYQGPIGDGPDNGGILNGGNGNDSLYGTGNDNEILNGGAGINQLFPDG